MSYDLYLHRKDDSKKPFSKTELKTLEENFNVQVVSVDPEQNVLQFTAAFKTNPNPEPDDFRYDDEDGNYWTYISYSANPTDFAQFIKITKDIGKALDTNVFDPQLGKNLDLSENIEDKNNLFERGQNILHHVIKKFIIQPETPATSKFFIMYLITSQRPNTDKKILLTQGQKNVYCSKVNRGETLNEVIQKEMPLLTGTSEYKLIDIQDGGFDFDRQGNKLPRINLYIEVPYFDPNVQNSQYRFMWEEL